MMAFGGYSLGASLPWFLVSIPIGVFALWYIYSRRGRQTARIISSLFLLQHLPRIDVRQKRFVPPLRFWLEVLLVVALVALISNVYVKDSRKTIAVLIDVSKSMSALHSEGTSRLEVAKRYARRDMLNVDRDVRYVIYSADDSLRLIDKEALRYFHSQSEAVRLVELATQSYRQDSLQNIVDELRQTPEFDEIWIYTDKQTDSSSKHERVRIISVPLDRNALHNVWIASAEILSATTDGAPVVQIDVRQEGLEGQSGSVELTCYSSRDKAVVATSMTRLASFQKNLDTIQISLPRDQWEYCYIEVSLSASSVRDSLAIDNHVWLVNRDGKSSVHVASPLSVEALKLDEISPYRFRPLSQEDLDRPYPAIFHRVALAENFNRDFLSIIPPKELQIGGHPAATSKVQGRALLTRWNESHPVMRYVRPSMMELSDPYVLECPIGSEGIMFVEQGPVMCVGQRGTYRYVITGFELFPFDGNRNRTLSVLTLNILNYLFAERDRIDGLGTVSTPLKAVHTDNSSEDGRVVTPPIVLAGVYELASKEGPGAPLQAVNFISNKESNLRAIEEISAGSVGEGFQRIRSDKTDASRDSDSTTAHLLLLTALVACFSDVLLRTVKRTSWRGR